MEREQIIKALRCIASEKDVLCEGCSYRKFVGRTCQRECAKDTLSLIRELIEEIEFRKKTIAENAQKALDVALEEIEKTKADTVRKMQEAIKERCIKGGIYPVLVARVVEQVAEEILEGN